MYFINNIIPYLHKLTYSQLWNLCFYTWHTFSSSFGIIKTVVSFVLAFLSYVLCWAYCTTHGLSRHFENSSIQKMHACKYHLLKCIFIREFLFSLKILLLYSSFCRKSVILSRYNIFLYYGDHTRKYNEFIYYLFLGFLASGDYIAICYTMPFNLNCTGILKGVILDNLWNHWGSPKIVEKLVSGLWIHSLKVKMKTKRKQYIIHFVSTTDT